MIQTFDQQQSTLCFLALELRPQAECLERTLPRAAAEELGALIAAELNRLYPGVDVLGLAFVGALFEPEELLKPGFRWAQWLNDQYRLSAPGSSTARLLFFGERDGRMPVRELQPDLVRPSGVLKLMPIVLRGAPDDLARVSAWLEDNLTRVGSAGPPVMQCVQGWCGQQVAHGCYMTLLDVLAFERAQLEATDLSALADLLEIVFLSPQRSERVQQAPAIDWVWSGREAEAHFLGERAWTKASGLPPERYRDYLRLQRSIAAGLDAFAIPRVWLDASAQATTFALEREPDPHPDAQLTIQSDSALGLISLTGTHAGERYTYWPLEPLALAAIRSHFAALS